MVNGNARQRNARRRAFRDRYVSASERDASSAQELDDEHDERKHEQEVDESTHRRQRHDAQQPEDEQDQNDGPEHGEAPPLDSSGRKAHAMAGRPPFRRARAAWASDRRSTPLVARPKSAP